MTMYNVTLFVKEYIQIKAGDFDYVETKTKLTLDWDGMQNLIGCMVTGSTKPVKFEISKAEEVTA